jgi:hypothetical protein
MGGFATISSGPSNPTVNNPAAAPNGLSLDSQNNILASVGQAGTESVLQAILLQFGQQPALTAITTAQTLFSKALNKAALNRAGRTLLVTGSLIYNTTSANVATITLALTLGGATVCTITTAATNTAASTGLPIQFEFYVSIPQAATLASNFEAPVVAHGNVSANIGTAAAGALTQYSDTNLPTESITIGTNPAVGVTLNVNGTIVTFIANGGSPVGNQVALGTTATGTATALYTFLNASTDVNIVKATYTNPSAGVVLMTSAVAGFQPFALGSAPADFTFTIPALNLTAAQTLALTIAASAAVPVAQLLFATVQVLA